MTENLPSKIGKYEVLEVLGQGGMGTVYKAFDPGFDRLVAIKVIVADYVGNPELLKRFYREAKAVGKLQHPNIVIVHELGEDNGNPYLVMEYLDGEPLSKIIKARRELHLLQKLGIIAQVCDALAYAHHRDIVHRDVKPANVLLLKDGQVKLLDFGIARLGNAGQSQTATVTGQVLGTVSYMAPEQLNEEIVDGRCDVYATGVMLFEMLTYRLPFESTDLGSLIAKKMQAGLPPSLSKDLENYPPELDDIVTRAMARDRDDRYSTAQDFAFDLGRLIERLRHDMVSHYVDRAREYISLAELDKAKELLSKVLKIDTQHTVAKELLYELQQSLQKQQRGEHIQQLRHQAETAIALKQFDEASKFVDQAIKLDRTDPDLLNLREHIQQVKQRSQQAKKLLHLAEVAQQAGELGAFQRAVEDALKLDPEDPQARVLEASLIRLQAEQEKEAQVQELLVAARREIAARQFDAAQEHIKQAEALDPNRNDLPALKQMVAAGQEQETRKRQLQALCSGIQKELEANNPKIARDLADKALRAFPGEPALVRMKSAADSQLEAEERRRLIEARIAAASKLLDAGEISSALTLIQEASRQFPADPRLRDFLQTLRQAAQQNAIQREQTKMLGQARDAMRQKRFAEAIEILEAGQIEYPDLRDIGDLLSLSRKEQKLLARQNKVADVTKEAQTLVGHQAFGDALSLLEKTLADASDPGLQKLLESVRKKAAEFDASLNTLQQEAMALLDAGHSPEALAKLQSQAARFGHSPGYAEFLQRVEERVREEEESKQQIARVLNEARFYLRRGALREAEGALAECRAKAPQDADVVALSSQLLEAKATLERERQIQATRVLEVPPYPAPKASPAAATVTFNPGAAVADLTPPPVIPSGSVDNLPGSEQVQSGGSPVAEAQGGPSATVLFEEPVAQPAVVREEIVIAPPDLPSGATPIGQRSAASTFPQVEPEPLPMGPAELPETRLPRPWFRNPLVLGVAALAVVLAALIVWLVSPAPQPKEATFNIKARPGAQILMDGKEVGTAASDGTISLPVHPGSHQLQAKLEGYKPWSGNVTAQAGERKPIVATLEPIPLPPPPPPHPLGNLSVRSNAAGADVFIDGQLKGVITGRDNKLKVSLEPGSHRIQLKKSGYEDSPEQTVEIVANKEKTLPAIPLREIGGQTFLTIDSNPRGASIRVDNRAAGTVGKGPLKVKVTPGPHTVEANLDGYEPWAKEKVAVKEDENLRVQAELKPRPVPAPSIGSFAATSGTIKKGEKTQLKWEAQNATNISIDNGVGVVQSSTGGRDVQPSETTTYTLTAKGPGGSTSARVTINVAPATPTTPPATVSFFKASPETIEAGEQTKLVWETENATTVYISPDIGKVPASGEKALKLDRTKDYTLNATGPGGSADPRSVTINVKAELPTPVERAPKKDDDRRIRDLLDAYVGAMQDKDQIQVRHLWPTITDKEYGKLTAAFRDAESIQISLDDCKHDPIVDGAEALVTCRQTFRVRSRGTQQTLTNTAAFTLRKLKTGEWIIDKAVVR